MGEVVRLAGIEEVEYTKEGQKRSFVRLHMIYGQDQVEGIRGCKVEQAFCPREVDPYGLKVGAAYELVYRLRDGRNGKTAVLVGLERVDEAEKAS